jgi:hypothetical protein
VGVVYHDTQAANLGGAYRPSEGADIQIQITAGGHNIGYMTAGEWLE